MPSNSEITDPESVAFDYDALGNRTSMEDDLGSVAYEYNALSELAAETRTFDDTSGARALPNGSISRPLVGIK